MRVLKDIIKEEMEEFQEEPLGDESPDPTSEEIPEEVPAEQPIIDEEPVGEIDPENSFYPPNEDYDYAPDVQLTGNPNNGIIYPAGSEIEPEAQPEPQEETLEEKKPKEGRFMKILTREEAIAVAKKNISEAKKALKEFDLAPMDDEIVEDDPMMDDEIMDDEIEETEPKTEEELVQDILADAEELYSKVAGEDDELGEEDPEMMDDSAISDEMLEAKKRVKEKIKARLRKKALKEKIKAKLARKKENVEEKLADDFSDEDVDDGVLDAVYESKKKIKENKVHELYNMLFDVKYNQDDSNRKEAFDEALDILGLTTKSKEAQEAWSMLKEFDEEKDEELEESEEESEEDVFFDEAKKRSLERKAYLKKILNEEDTPIMSEQPDVETLMGLKILKKMGEDPKLVESKSKKFVKNYQEKKSFDFKKLLESGFLG